MAVERIEPSRHAPPTGEARLLFLYRAAAATGSAAVDRYRRRVALLKRLLPAIGVALLLLVAAWPRVLALWKSPLVPPAIDLRQARQLTMVDARFAGVDRQNRPYVVTAALARQLPNQKDLLALQTPRAELTARPGSRIVMTAGSGVYQSAAGLLDLFGRVDLLRPDGSRFETRRAHLDLSANTARGEDPVEGQGPQGTISARGFRILDKGNTILFTGKARAVLYTGESDAPAAPPALPPAVARKAALLETAALARWRPKRAAKPRRSPMRSVHKGRPLIPRPALRGPSPRRRPSLQKAPGDGR
jgi:lipopolysaccharide export system protein LptC